MPSPGYDSAYSTKSAVDSLPGHKVQFSRHDGAGAASVYNDTASQANVPLVGYSSSLAVPGSAGGTAASSSSFAATPGMSAANSGADFRRKRSLVRPDRERVDESHRLYNYRQHAAAMEAEGRGTAAVSRTGHSAAAGLLHPVGPAEVSGAAAASASTYPHPHALPPGAGGAGPSGSAAAAAQPSASGSTTLRRGKSILAREEGMANETGVNLFKRGGTMRRVGGGKLGKKNAHAGGAYERGQKAKQQAAGPPMGAWMIYCRILTACFPAPLLKCFGASSSPSRARSPLFLS